MTYQVLARKWRPKVFGEVIGQEHVTRTLQNTVKKSQVAHAYLLTGTRGVGKTTIARIFAKAIRCENLTSTGDPCLDCASCRSIDDGSSLDYLEIDGASNTGVDSIRELIDNVQYLPTSGNFKVYVIDEVHMLSVNAFNALLKTLEEPPKHVVFIFATTDPQKLLGTVLSRCQRFDFKTVKLDELVQFVKKIALAEKITFEKEELIIELAKQGKGSVRDTLSLLDQVLSLSIDRSINEETLLLSLGLANTKAIQEILNAIIKGDKKLCSDYYHHALNENVDLSKFSLQILDSLFRVIESIDAHENTVAGLVDSSLLEPISIAELLWIYETLAKDFQWALTSLEPEKVILFCLSKICLRDQIFGNQDRAAISKKSTESVDDTKQTQQVQQIAIQQLDIQNKIACEAKIEDLTWDDFLESLKKNHPSLVANLERGNLLSDIAFGKEIVIEVAFTQENKIFFDYLNDGDVKKRLKDELAAYFQTKEIDLFLTVLDEKTKESRKFMSKVEIEQETFNLAQEEKKKKILENKYIKEAEKLFNSQIDKIILTEDK